MPLTYRLIRSKRRTVALIVQLDGELLVRAPLRLPAAQIKAFVESKQDWILMKQAEAQAARNTAPPPRQYIPGEKFAYLGNLYPLEIVVRTRPALALEDGYFRLAQNAQPHAQKTFEHWYHIQAAQVLGQQTAAWASLLKPFGCEPTKIRISSARSRWGSCSSRGTLSFTWRLVMAPLPIIEYVVVHELVHLRIHNHSQEFWQMVKKFMPDYAGRRAWLKANGHSLA